MAARGALDPLLRVLPGTDIDDVWERFEVFEALHHSLTICSPMNDGHLDELLDVLALQPDQHVLDMACGYGELLIRSAGRSGTVGTGIDLSPWMMRRAVQNARDRVPQATIDWVVGEARDFRAERVPDVCVCLGAEWVWHDVAGTARALASRLLPGGLAVIGAARLHRAADQKVVRSERGHVDTIEDVDAMLDAAGLRPEHRIDPTDQDWDRYLADTKAAAAQWQADHPGVRSDRWIEEQADWQAARERDRDIIGWSVWIARRPT